MDGQRVVLRGRYEKIRVAMRPDTRPVDLSTSGTVSITTEAGGVMLEIYHRDAGRRPVAEIRRFHGRPVEVVGTLHGSTPAEVDPGGAPMATMTGPYIQVESIAPLE